MNGFYVTYSSKFVRGSTTGYQVDFLKRNRMKFEKEFTLYPSVNVHPRMGAVYNPDTKHFLSRDYYTYISQANAEPDFIVIKAIMNPYINILWAGAIIMIAGFSWAFWRRIRRKSMINQQ